MGYAKGSVNRLLIDEYTKLHPRPTPSSPEWDKFLADFRWKYPVEVSRMREPLEDRALYVLKYRIPDWA